MWGGVRVNRTVGRCVFVLDWACCRAGLACGPSACTCRPCGWAILALAPYSLCHWHCPRSLQPVPLALPLIPHLAPSLWPVVATPLRPSCSIARCLAAPQLHVTVPPELVAAGTAGCSPEARAAASLSAGQRTLPRASLVCHGGDLAYPSPTGGGQLGWLAAR
jgi:hypothetical protein